MLRLCSTKEPGAKVEPIQYRSLDMDKNDDAQLWCDIVNRTAEETGEDYYTVHMRLSTSNEIIRVFVKDQK